LVVYKSIMNNKKDSSDESDLSKSSDESDSAKYSPYDDITSISTDEEEQGIEREVSQVNGSTSEVPCNKQMLEPRTVEEKQGIKRKSSQMNESSSEAPCKKQEMQCSALDEDSSSSTVTSSSFGDTPVPSTDSSEMSNFSSLRSDTSNDSADVSSAMNSDHSAIQTENEISESDSIEEADMADVEGEIDPPRLDNNVSVAQHEDPSRFVRPQLLVTYREEESSLNIFALRNPATTPRVQDTDSEESVTGDEGSAFESDASSPDDTSDRSDRMNSSEASIDCSHLQPSNSRQNNDAQNGRASAQFPAPPRVPPMPVYIDPLRNNRNVVYPERVNDNVPVQQRHYLARQREQLEQRRNMHARWLHERAHLMRSVRDRMRGRGYENAPENGCMFNRNAGVNEELDPNLQVIRDLQQDVIEGRILPQDEDSNESDDENNYFIRHEFPIWDMDARVMVYMAMEFHDLPRGATRAEISNSSTCRFHNRHAARGRDECGGSDVNEQFCTICLSQIEHDEFIRILRCGHFYHVSCIDRWLVINDSCAVCRQTVSR
ncbi:E3 ubiquitin-protein ligase RNF12, partial [Trichinella papuae]